MLLGNKISDLFNESWSENAQIWILGKEYEFLMGRLPLAFWPTHEFLCLYKLNKPLFGILGFFSPFNHPIAICWPGTHDCHCNLISHEDHRTHLTFPTKCTTWLLVCWGPIQPLEPSFMKASHTVSFALQRTTATEFLGDSDVHFTRTLIILVNSVLWCQPGKIIIWLQKMRVFLHPARKFCWLSHLVFNWLLITLHLYCLYPVHWLPPKIIL